MDHAGKLIRDTGLAVAYDYAAGALPAAVFLPGLRSDMQGAKALEVLAFCRARGQAMLRLDYTGHGASDGRFEDGTISAWAADALAVIEAVAHGPVVLIGSSMGGWIGLLLARALGGRVAGFIGIAAAPDFSEDLMWASMSPAQRDAVLRDGRTVVPSAYDPLTITRAFIEDGRENLVLRAPIPLACPVRLLQGQRDADVPWETALTLARTIEAEDVQVTIIKDGDHRLSRPQDLALLTRTLGALLDGVSRPLVGEDRSEA